MVKEGFVIVNPEGEPLGVANDFGDPVGFYPRREDAERHCAHEITQTAPGYYAVRAATLTISPPPEVLVPVVSREGVTVSEAKPLSIDDLVAFHMAGEGVKGLRFPKGLRYYAVSLRTWVQAPSAREAVAQVVSNIRSNDPLVDELLGFSVTYGEKDPYLPQGAPRIVEETFYLKDVKEG